MRKMLFAALFFLLLAPQLAFAQAVGTQQQPSHLDAANLLGTSATSAATITITPAATQAVYVTGVEITNCAGASAVTAAAVTSVTTTNLSGAAWTLGSGTTAGACQPPITTTYPTGLKSAPLGGVVTFVLPTFATNQTVRVSVYGYFAP